MKLLNDVAAGVGTTDKMEVEQPVIDDTLVRRMVAAQSARLASEGAVRVFQDFSEESLFLESLDELSRRARDRNAL